MFMACGNSSKKLSISKTWWFVLNLSEIFFEAFVSSILWLNFTDIDSILIEGNSFLNNAKTSVESIPELNEIPILSRLSPTSFRIVFLIWSSIVDSSESYLVSLKSSGEIFFEESPKFVE